ncbi:hypothetical protein TNCV_4952281 [Trichonephila clavipes]|nr:hypothetical protein TNCV_4952281 [Trichonephila clavipes]
MDYAGRVKKNIHKCPKCPLAFYSLAKFTEHREEEDKLESLIEDGTALDQTTPPPADWKKRVRRRKPKPSGKGNTQPLSKADAHEKASTSKTLVGYFEEGKPLQSKWCPQCERELLLAIPLADHIKMCHNVVFRKENQGPSHTVEVRVDPDDVVDATQVALDTSVAVQKHEHVTVYAFTCPFCEKGFHAEANMAEHIAQLHEQSPPTEKPPSCSRGKNSRGALLTGERATYVE